MSDQPCICDACEGRTDKCLRIQALETELSHARSRALQLENEMKMLKMRLVRADEGIDLLVRGMHLLFDKLGIER